MAEPLYYPGGWPMFQLEADPDVASSNPQLIPETFARFLNTLNPRVIYRYNTEAQRNAELAPIQGVTYFAFTADTNSMITASAVTCTSAPSAVRPKTKGMPWCPRP